MKPKVVKLISHQLSRNLTFCLLSYVHLISLVDTFYINMCSGEKGIGGRGKLRGQKGNNLILKVTVLFK